MKNLLTTAFVLSSLLAAPGIIVTSASAQGTCGPDAPAAWSRPGGYCDQQKSGRSLSSPNASDCTSYEYVFPEASVLLEKKGIRLHLAATCSIDCGQYYESSVDLRTLAYGERARVADIPAGCLVD